MKPGQLSGQKFGRLTILHREANSRHGKTRWLCRCDCGTQKIVLAATLLRGESRSCGCLLKRGAVKHGMSGTPTYRIWKAMRVRCHNPRQASYPRYGGRGITVCQRWNDFANFLADMGERPPGCSIDRINNDGNYEPGNCRWASPQTQADNSRRPTMLTFDGKTMSLSAWARHLGINVTTLLERLEKWPREEALSRPKSRRWSRRPHPIIL